MRAELLAAIQAEAHACIDAPGPARIVVWGAGELGHWLMRSLGARGVAFVDTNPTKLGCTIAGRAVHAPEDVEQLEPDEVWVAVLSDSAGIVEQLRARGIAHRLVFPDGKRLQVQDQLPRTLEFLGQHDLAGREVLEVGCGGQLFLALTALHLGAASVRVTDVGPLGDVLTERRPEWLAFLAHLERVHPTAGRGARSKGRDVEQLLECVQVEPTPMDAAQLAFADGSFDAILNTGVMEHVDDPAGALVEFERLLRPGGLLLCLAIGIHDHRSNDPSSAFTPWSFLALDAEAWGALGGGAYHQNRWRSVDFTRCCERTGLRILEASATRDARLAATEVASFDPSFRSQYSLEELADLDLFLAAVAS